MAFSHLTLRYERELLRNENIPEQDKKAILDFVDGTLLLEGIGETRRMNYAQRLRIVARWIPETFLNPSKEDIISVIRKLGDVQDGKGKDDKKYSEWTKVTYLKMLKKFYKKTLPKDKFESLFQDVKIKTPRQTIEASDLISRGEVQKLISVCGNARDKALLATLYDSGCRIGEILGMKLKHLGFDPYGAKLTVPRTGKTGTREVRIVGDSIPYLRAWIGIHPMSNDPNAPLFCNIAEGIKGREMTYDDVYKVLRSALKRANLKKRIYPHLFRHTRASILASKVAESPLSEMMGWIQGTRQIATYVHLNPNDVDKAVLSQGYGIDVQDIDKEDVRKCPRCLSQVPSNAMVCPHCFAILDQALAIKTTLNFDVSLDKEQKIPGSLTGEIKNYEAMKPLLLMIQEMQKTMDEMKKKLDQKS